MDAQVRTSEAEIQTLKDKIAGLVEMGSQAESEVESLREVLKTREAERDSHTKAIGEFNQRIKKAEAQINSLSDTLAQARAREALSELRFRDVDRLISNGFLEAFQFRIGTGGVWGASPNSAGSDLALGFRFLNGQIGAMDTRAITVDVVQRSSDRSTAVQASLFSSLIIPQCVEPYEQSQCGAGAWGFNLKFIDFGTVIGGRRLLRIAEMAPFVSLFPSRRWLRNRLLLLGGVAVDYVWNAANEPHRILLRPEIGVQVLQRVGPLHIAANAMTVVNAIRPVGDHGQELYLGVLRWLSWRPGRRDQHMEASLQLGVAYWRSPQLEYGVDWQSTSQATFFTRIVLAPSFLSSINDTDGADGDLEF
jgi:hypothetical protein